MGATAGCHNSPPAQLAEATRSPPVVHPIYKDQIQAYFDKYNIEITWKIVKGGELNKTMDVSDDCARLPVPWWSALTL
jgi:hypothetical protein